MLYAQKIAGILVPAWNYYCGIVGGAFPCKSMSKNQMRLFYNGDQTNNLSSQLEAAIPINNLYNILGGIE